jgi:hypothetical protein
MSVQPIEIGKAENLATAKAIAECHAAQNEQAMTCYDTARKGGALFFSKNDGVGPWPSN